MALRSVFGFPGWSSEDTITDDRGPWTACELAELSEADMLQESIICASKSCGSDNTFGVG